jgi:nitrogen fixation/metabolism regulation signal transduction histidine kinase
VAYAKVKYGTIRYQLIVTVPKSDVTKSSTEVQTSINTTTTAMIVVFVIIMIIFTIVIVLLSLSLIRAIVNPINELKEVLALVTQDDLSGHVPTQASSKDMKILLDAFGSFMIALRFGSDSYARGNRTRAFETFNEALQLYTATSE